MHVCMVSISSEYSRMDQPDLVANPARGQPNTDLIFLLWPRSRLRIWSRETDSAVPSRVSPVILQTQTESGAYSGASLYPPPAIRDSIFRF